ncbi:hypothetical protein [Paenibacillus radicibacter]|nr:hypothetical protein [Paenibacillus radicibacter]
MRTSYAKQGYVAEAVHAITNFAILELQPSRIEIRCDTMIFAKVRGVEYE